MPACIKNLLSLLLCLALLPLVGYCQVKKTARKQNNSLKTQAVDCVAALAGNTITAPDVTSSCFNAGHGVIKGSILTATTGTYKYGWQTSTDGVDFTDLNVPYADLNPTNTVGVTYYRRVVTYSECAVPSVTDPVKITILPPLSNIFLTPPPVVDFCGTVAKPGTIIGSDPTGGDGTYQYQWYNFNKNSSTPIIGATGRDLVLDTITESKFYYRQVTSGGCSGGGVALHMTLTPFTAIDNNTISQATPDGPFCAASVNPAPITGTTPKGSSGSFTFQWQLSTNGTDFTDVTDVPAQGQDMDPGEITQTTYYRRIAIPVNGTACDGPQPSNVLKITVYPPVTNNVITAPSVASFCDVGDAGPIQGSTPAGGYLAYTYQWESATDGVNFSAIPAAQDIRYDPPVSNVTTYYRRVVSSYTCNTPLVSNVITITVNSIADNVITAPSVVNFCGNGDAEVITGSKGGTSSYTYQWQASADGITFANVSDLTSDPTAINYDPPSSSSTIYYRRKTTSVICGNYTYSNIVKITVDPMPGVSADATICYGAGTVLTASGGTSYKWSPADGLSATNIAQPIASPLVNTTYTVTVTNSSCTMPLIVTVNVVPKPTVDAGTDKAVLIGDNVRLAGKVTGGDGVTYSWSPATYLDDPNSLSPVSTPLADITYTLIATSPNGCFIVSDDVSIKAYNKVIVPTAFTPNGDGINDTWDIAALSSYHKSVLSIFTRTGALIFKSVGYAKPWDGTYNGKLLPFATYYYIIDLNNTLYLNNSPQTISGWVTIVK